MYYTTKPKTMIKRNIILILLLFTTFKLCYSQRTYYGYQERSPENQVNYGKIAEDVNKSIQNTLITRYYESGNRKYESKDYSGAIQDYTNIIKLNPNLSTAYYNRGLANYNLQYFSSACLDWLNAGKLGDANAYSLIREYCN